MNWIHRFSFTCLFLIPIISMIRPDTVFLRCVSVVGTIDKDLDYAFTNKFMSNCPDWARCWLAADHWTESIHYYPITKWIYVIRSEAARGWLSSSGFKCENVMCRRVNNQPTGSVVGERDSCWFRGGVQYGLSVVYVYIYSNVCCCTRMDNNLNSCTDFLAINPFELRAVG